jgi:mono/diheme cytochrome c family protein
MDTVMNRIGKAWAWPALFCLGVVLGLALGCGGGKEKGDGNPEAMGVASPQQVLAKLPGGAEFAAGKKVYADHNCASCHKLGETGGSPGDSSGPNLTWVGAMPKQWIAEHVRDAKKHSPSSRMPSFPPEELSDADLKHLADYLASRKQ